MKTVCLTTRVEWREWLAQNHDQETEIWLVFYKKHTGRPTLDYDDMVEDALCFGWIDSLTKKIDDDSYARKLTPRRADSAWSDANKQRVNQLLRQKRIEKPGRAVIEKTKKSGRWSESARPPLAAGLPGELKTALARNKKAKTFFTGLAPGYQNHFIGWIASAKRPETRQRRFAEAIRLLEQGKKLGLK